MSRHKRVTAGLAILGLGLAATGTAAAENTGWYFGLFGGTSSVDLADKALYDQFFVSDMNALVNEFGASVLQIDESSVDDSGNAWGVQIGYRWNSYVATEIGYLDLGQARYDATMTLQDALGVVPQPGESNLRYTSHGPTVAVLGMLPITERFDLHARAGVYFADTRLRMGSAVPGAEVEVQPGVFEPLAFSQQLRSDTKELLAGVGAAWNINQSYSVRVEYQRLFDVGDEKDGIGESDVDLFSFSVLFR